DTRQPPKLVGRSGEGAPPRNLSSAGNQVAGPRVVTKPSPFRENVLVARSGKCFEIWPARDKTLEPRRHGCDRRLLEHDLTQPDAIRVRRRLARRRAPRGAPEVIHIMLQEALRGIGGHDFAMACSPSMSKEKTSKEDSPRSCRVRSAGELIWGNGRTLFPRFSL